MLTLLWQSTGHSLTLLSLSLVQLAARHVITNLLTLGIGSLSTQVLQQKLSFPSLLPCSWRPTTPSPMCSPSALAAWRGMGPCSWETWRCTQRRGHSSTPPCCTRTPTRTTTSSTCRACLWGLPCWTCLR